MEPAVHSLDISKSRDARERLIVALDVSSAKAARRIVEAVGDSALTYKVGMQLYTAEGPSVVRDMVASGRQVFLDLKYHDIPNPVGAAVREAASLGVSMLTVHGSGGERMLHEAVEAARTRPGMMVLAVTVLLKHGEEDLALACAEPVGEQVVGSAAAGNGSTVVASAHGLRRAPTER
jgi:orotidine-5'-phosphate decarboxylase